MASDPPGRRTPPVAPSLAPVSASATANDRRDTEARIRASLLAARNKDGGWPYRPGNKSRLETTCWAILGLGMADGGKILRGWPRADRLLVDVPGTPVNYTFNALAALTMLARPDTVGDADPVIRKLVEVKGLTYPRKNDVVIQDSSLPGWGWVENTACWVEPTAWCVLVLKKRRGRGPIAGADERISIGEALLFDRVCSNGGWNFGNPHVYDKNLWPYVPTTAFALMALQDHPQHPVVQKSQTEMHADLKTEHSVLALSLAVICGRVYGENTAGLEDELIAQYKRAGAMAERDVLATAIMACALSAEQSGVFALERGARHA